MSPTGTAIQVLPSPPISWRDSSLTTNLRLATSLPIPVPGPRQVLVNIRAAALNARDLMVVAHDPIYPITTIPNLSPSSDGAGLISSVGASSKWAGKEGAKVVLCPSIGWLKRWKESGVGVEEGELRMDELGQRGGGDVEGCLREFAVVDDEEVFAAPAHLSLEQLAALPTAGGTAYNALFCGPSPIQNGQTVLIQGTGGVSCFAIQLAAARGCTVIATSSSDAKLAISKELGATHLINYTETPDWDGKVLELTKGRGVDVVVDVGGASSIVKSLNAVKQAGIVSVVGNLSEGSEEGVARQLLFGGKTLRGIFGMTGKCWESCLRFVDENRVVPMVDKVYEWNENGVKKAFELLGQRVVVGKIVVKVGSD